MPSAVRRNQDTFEAIYGTIEQVVDRLATVENWHFAPHPERLAHEPEWRGEPAPPSYPPPAALPSRASGERLGRGAGEGREEVASAASGEGLVPLAADRPAPAAATE